MPKLTMSPPTWGEVLTLLDEGKPKYGWKWMVDEGGNWWGAREGTAEILHVQPVPPDFPCRRWNQSGNGYTPTPRLVPLKPALAGFP